MCEGDNFQPRSTTAMASRQFPRQRQQQIRARACKEGTDHNEESEFEDEPLASQNAILPSLAPDTNTSAHAAHTSETYWNRCTELAHSSFTLEYTLQNPDPTSFNINCKSVTRNLIV